MFTIGLVSHRSQSALTHARDVLRNNARANANHAHDTMAHAQSYLVLVGNAVLGVIAVIAAVVAGLAEGPGGGDWVTLVGFCVLEAAVIGLGWHDHCRVRNALNDALQGTGTALARGRQALAAE